MHVFQILNNEVTAIDGEKSYIDTIENFIKDGYAADVPDALIYDAAQKCCVVNGSFWDYPNADVEAVIAKIDDFIAAKEKRMPKPEVPVTDPKTTLREDYEDGVKELSDNYTIACLRGDTEAQTSIKQDFADLQTAYKEEMEALENEV